MNDVAFEREIVEVFGLESTVRERTRTLDRNKRLQAADKHNRHGCDIPGPHGTGPPSLPSRGSHDRFLGVPLAVPAVSGIVPLLVLRNRT